MFRHTSIATTTLHLHITIIMAQKALETLEHIHASRYKEARKAITAALDKRKDNAQYVSLLASEIGTRVC